MERILPAPGTHEADVEELRVGALFRKELSKPPGQRDEELVHTLSVEFYKLQLANSKAKAATYANYAACYGRPDARQCCAAAGWVWQRVAASHRALHDFHSQIIQQASEELAAAEARRPAVIATEPTLHLDLSGALQQQPPRLDMCRVCAGRLEEMELAEESCRVYAFVIQKQFQERGMQAVPAAAAASWGPAAAPAAPGLSVGEQGQQEQQCGGDSHAGGAEGAPATPKQQPLPQQQQQHASSDQEQQQQQQQQQQRTWSAHEQQQEQQQEKDAADERRLLLPKAQR